MGGGLDHPSRATRRAEPAAFAAEGNEMLVTAGIALDAQKAVLEPAALQVIVELPPDERGQRSAFGFESGEKLRIVGLDDRIERGLFWPMALVGIPVGAAGLCQSSSPAPTWVDEAAGDRAACLPKHAMICWRL